MLSCSAPSRPSYLLGDHEGLAVLTLDERVGILVAPEALGGLVEQELAPPHPVGDVAEVDEDGAAMALLDVGVYSIALAHMFFGPPSDVSGFANLAPTGVDEEAALVLRHVGGELSTLLTAIRLNTPHQATLIGVDGWIDLHPNWWSPSNFTLHRDGKKPELFDIATPLHGFSYEALAVSDHLRAGELESPIMPLKDTLAIAETMDQARQLWGITYPME